MIEVFELHFDVESFHRWHDGNTLLDSYKFEDQPCAGPIVAYRRQLPESFDDGAITTYVQGNLAPRSTFQDLVEVSLDGVVPMPELEFWRLIDTSRRRTVRMTTNALARGLAKGGRGYVMAFEPTLRRVLHDLDSPTLLDSGIGLPGGVPLSTDSGLYFRCGLVLGGAAVVAAALDDPGRSFELQQPVDAEELLSVSSAAWLVLTGESVLFESTVDFETGRNSDNWTGVAHEEVVRPYLDEPDEDEDGRPLWAGADFLAGSVGEWASARVFLALPNHREEIVILFTVRPPNKYAALSKATVNAVAHTHSKGLANQLGGSVIVVEAEDLHLGRLIKPASIFYSEQRWKGSAKSFADWIGLGAGLLPEG